MNKFIKKILRNLHFKAIQLRVSRIWCPKNKRKVIQSRINNYELLVLANEDVGRSIHFAGRYEYAETKYLQRMIRSNAVCVDVGANVGYFTMLMAQKASAGSVHAFEPIALNASLLKASVELNGFTNIHINQCAVGDTDGFVSFSQSSDSAYSSIHDTERKPLEHTLTVPLVTLDNYLDREEIERVDVLKVDVEGGEGLVVAGATKLLSNKNRRPYLILLELQDLNFQAFGTSVATILEKMQFFGYSPFVISARGEVLPFNDELKEHFYNVLFTPSEK